MQKSIVDGIGNTPMFSFENYKGQLGLCGDLFAKLEKYNPLGSAKDRVAKYMICEAMQSGRLKEGGTVIEPTSGNTGIGIAFVGKQLGLKVILTMPSSMSKERIDLIRALGGEVVLTDKALGIPGSQAKVLELLEEIEGSITLDQFGNPQNPRAHYETTAPEIWEQMDGKVDVFVAGIGTGGTISGVGKFLKEKNPNVEIVGCEPASSPFITKGEKGAHQIQGIGAGFLPACLDMGVVDRVVAVSNEDAFSGVHELAKTTSQLVGISSGCAYFVAKAIACDPQYAGKRIVVLFPDGGEKYFSVENYLAK